MAHGLTCADTMTRTGWRADVLRALASMGAIAGLTAMYFSWLHVTNPTTVALSFLLVILFVAAASRLWVAVAASVTAALAFDFFFLPPVGTFNINDPQDWIAFFSFITVSLVASQLSLVARTREHELGRLFDFSRDALLGADGDPVRSLAERIAERFRLEYVAIYLPTETAFDRHETGTLEVQAMPSIDDLRRVANVSTVGGDNIAVTAAEGRFPLRLVPLRHRTQAIGVLAVAGRRIEPASLNALASVVAIAVERVHLLEQRKQAEASRRSVEIKSALLGSLAHDLRTPLTAIKMAVNNLSVSSLTEVQRAGQADIALTGLERLTRLFQNILEMARIDAGSIMPLWSGSIRLKSSTWHDVRSSTHCGRTRSGSSDRPTARRSMSILAWCRRRSRMCLKTPRSTPLPSPRSRSHTSSSPTACVSLSTTTARESRRRTWRISSNAFSGDQKPGVTRPAPAWAWPSFRAC